MTENDDNNNLSEKEKNIYNRILTENGINKNACERISENVKNNEKVIRRKNGTWVNYLCCVKKNTVASETITSIDMGNRKSTPVIPINTPLNKK
jgi:hypothetical protein